LSGCPETIAGEVQLTVLGIANRGAIAGARGYERERFSARDQTALVRHKAETFEAFGYCASTDVARIDRVQLSIECSRVARAGLFNADSAGSEQGADQ